MVALAAGYVVLVTFPFSDLSATKLRPAIILAYAGRNDWILCQITSNAYGDKSALSLSTMDFIHGTLQRDSFIRPGKLFTANSGIIKAHVGILTKAKLPAIRKAVVSILCG